MWNCDRSEIIADGVVHAIGVSLGLVGVVVLFLSVIHVGDAGEVTAVAVYAGGLLATLGLSAAYNMWPVSWKKLRFQNAIWHGFVLVATCCHYTAILEFVVMSRI
jgi:hemolysin III